MGGEFLFLEEITPHLYAWITESGEEVGLSAPHIEEAIRIARREEGFQPLNCGFRFTLPERDEHGENALFHQMGASHEAFNGIYFDQDLGHNCIVREASQEALSLWKKENGRRHN